MGRYELIQELGRGAMGVVYRARQQGLDRDVALKFMLDGADPDSAPVARFRREMQALIALSHPNVIRLLDAGEQDGKLFYAMELLDAVDLQRVLDAKKTFSAAQTAAVLAQLLDALEYVHGRGLVHRDIKPQNVMLERARGAILMDFGLARKVDGTLLTEQGRALGTPRYMAPELWRSEEHGPPADLYALGCTAYAMLAGAPPFVAPDVPSLVRSILNEPPAPLNGKCPDLDPALAALIHSFLEKDPVRRPASAAAARAELVRLTTAGDPLPTVRTTLDGAPRPRRTRSARAQAPGPALTAPRSAFPARVLVAALTAPRSAFPARVLVAALTGLALTGLALTAVAALLVRPARHPPPAALTASATSTPAAAETPDLLARRLIQSVRSSRLTTAEVTRTWHAIRKRLVARGWKPESMLPGPVIARDASIAQPLHELVAAARGANDLGARLSAARPHLGSLLENASTNDELRADLLNAIWRLDMVDALACALGAPAPFGTARCLSPALEVAAAAAPATPVATAACRPLFPAAGGQGLMLYHPDQDPRRGGEVGDSMSTMFMSSTGRKLRGRDHATSIALKDPGHTIVFLVCDMHPSGYLRLSARGLAAPLQVRLPAGAPCTGEWTWIAVRLRGALARSGAWTLEHRRAYDEYARPYVLVESVLVAP